MALIRRPTDHSCPQMRDLLIAHCKVAIVTGYTNSPIDKPRDFRQISLSTVFIDFLESPFVNPFWA